MRHRKAKAQIKVRRVNNFEALGPSDLPRPHRKSGVQQRIQFLPLKSKANALKIFNGPAFLLYAYMFMHT